MNMVKLKTVTIFYYCESSLGVKHQVCQFIQNDESRISIPPSFKQGKSIIAVCDGVVNVLNKVGERAMQTKHFAIAS